MPAVPRRAQAAPGVCAQQRFNGELDLFRQFHALRVQEFDAVLRSGVVRSRDDHSGVRAQFARQKGNAGGRQHAQIQHLRAAREESFGQRGLQAGAGYARIAADDEERHALLISTQHARGCRAERAHKIFRHRRRACCAADAVCSKIPGVSHIKSPVPKELGEYQIRHDRQMV